MLLLHGVPTSAFLWRRTLPELAARGLRGVALDLPGLGLAERPRTFDYSWTSLAAWCERAADALALDRFHLVVHDIGGPIGFDLARRAPARIASLTVLNTIARPASFRRPWPMAPFAHRGVGEAWLRGTGGTAFVALMRRTGVLEPVPAAELEAHLRLLRRDDGGWAFLRVMRSFDLTEAFERRVLAALRARPYPAQVLWGEQDPLLRLRPHGEQARAAVGVDQLRRLRARHFVPEDRPAEIAAAVAALAADSPVN